MACDNGPNADTGRACARFAGNRDLSFAGSGAVDRPRADRSLPEGLRAFAHRDYRVFWFTQLFSLTGTWVQSLAQSWLVLTLTNSPAALGLIGVCQFGPTLILGLPAGVLVDRLPKRRLLMVTQIASAAIIGVLALLVATGQVQLWQIYAAAIALGIVSAVDMPARQAFVVDLVGKDDLMNAIALNSALFNTTRVAGPALAGLLLAAFGPADLLRPQRGLLRPGHCRTRRDADPRQAKAWRRGRLPCRATARRSRLCAQIACRSPADHPRRIDGHFRHELRGLGAPPGA